jgi:uncharacterized SAM-binding protein YcdF (DUF218 family)
MNINRAMLYGLSLAVSWPLIAYGCASQLLANRVVASPDALVIFSGSGAYRERTRRAAEIFLQDGASFVLLTNDGQLAGWSTSKQRNSSFVELAFEALEASGVPSSSIEVLDSPVSSTFTEVMAVRALAEARGLHSIMFVTSPYHSRRALWTIDEVFARTGKRVGLDYAPLGSRASPGLWRWWLSTRGWKQITSEYVKTLYYRVRYSRAVGLAAIPEERQGQDLAIF